MREALDKAQIELKKFYDLCLDLDVPDVMELLSLEDRIIDTRSALDDLEYEISRLRCDIETTNPIYWVAWFPEKETAEKILLYKGDNYVSLVRNQQVGPYTEFCTSPVQCYTSKGSGGQRAYAHTLKPCGGTIEVFDSMDTLVEHLRTLVIESESCLRNANYKREEAVSEYAAACACRSKFEKEPPMSGSGEKG